MSRAARILAVAALGLVAGCGAMMATADQTARDAAKRAVTPIVQARFPGVPVEPVVDCVIQHAETAEILELARAATLGPTAETTVVVTEIATRPDTVRCIASAQTQTLLGGIFRR